MAVVYQYSDVLQNMYGNGDVKQAKRVRPVTLGGQERNAFVMVEDFTSFAKGDAGSMLYLMPIAWTSTLVSLSSVLNNATSSEDLQYKIDIFGATGVPSSRTGDDNARIGNLTKLKEWQGATLWGSHSANVTIYSHPAFSLRGKTIYECVTTSDSEKLAFEPFKNTPHGFLGVEVSTKSSQMPDDTSAMFRISYVEGAPSGMPLDKIAI